MPEKRNKRIKSILLDKNGYCITVRQAAWRIRYLRSKKAKDPELFELNGGSHNLLLLLQYVQETKKWNGEKRKVEALSQAQNDLLTLKIPKVCPETYRCGVPIRALETPHLSA